MDSSLNNWTICITFPSCVLNILALNRLFDKAYYNLYGLYKVIWTLSVIQVQCARKVSKLKITRINSMSEENFESFIEKELLDELAAEAIIQRFLQLSADHKRFILITL